MPWHEVNTPQTVWVPEGYGLKTRYVHPILNSAVVRTFAQHRADAHPTGVIRYREGSGFLDQWFFWG